MGDRYRDMIDRGKRYPREDRRDRGIGLGLRGEDRRDTKVIKREDRIR